MTEEGYKNRVKRYLKRDKVKASAAEIAAIVKANYGKNPPSVAALQLHPKSTTRNEKRKKAGEKFEEVLNVCCNVFKQDKRKAKTGDDENWRDLRSAAAYIGLKKLKIRPASALAELMGLPSPAAVYHASNRAERLILERVLFKQTVELICRELKIK